MDEGSADREPLRVTFVPELYLQRRIWVLDVLRREDVVTVWQTSLPFTLIFNAIYVPGC